jgi:hypothetical protein
MGTCPPKGQRQARIPRTAQNNSEEAEKQLGVAETTLEGLLKGLEDPAGDRRPPNSDLKDVWKTKKA